MVWSIEFDPAAVVEAGADVGQVFNARVSWTDVAVSELEHRGQKESVGGPQFTVFDYVPANLLIRKESLVFIVSADPEPEESVLQKKGKSAVAFANAN